MDFLRTWERLCSLRKLAKCVKNLQKLRNSCSTRHQLCSFARTGSKLQKHATSRSLGVCVGRGGWALLGAGPGARARIRPDLGGDPALLLGRGVLGRAAAAVKAPGRGKDLIGAPGARRLIYRSEVATR